MSFQDHFSGHAAAYASHRPGYPPELFGWLAAQVPAHSLAWDCATGSGQAALGLAAQFERVVATDAAAAQLAHAGAHARVDYRVAAAEASGLAAASVDLVTVAQALHWFDLDAFYREARRVLRPGGALAVWCYGLCEVDPAIDALLGWFYRELVGPYWPPERRHIDARYADLAFPFAEQPVPAFAMRADWDRAALLAYLGTWSAVVRCRRATGTDPIAELEPRLREAWGAATVRTVRWPLAVRLGRP
jgi:SAM-dependent methyltransferase